jgi:hypothetical protein
MPLNNEYSVKRAATPCALCVDYRVVLHWGKDVVLSVALKFVACKTQVRKGA